MLKIVLDQFCAYWPYVNNRFIGAIMKHIPVSSVLFQLDLLLTWSRHRARFGCTGFDDKLIPCFLGSPRPPRHRRLWCSVPLPSPVPTISIAPDGALTFLHLAITEATFSIVSPGA